MTVVSPNENISGASLEKLTSCMSITSGTVRIISIPSGFVASRVTLLTKISGADLSTIVTNCVDVPILPAPSVAVQVTTVSPNGKNSGASLKNDAILTSSKTSGSIVVWVEEESYFFKLSVWGKKLLKFYEENPNFILPESRKNEVINFVKKGLKGLK